MLPGGSHAWTCRDPALLPGDTLLPHTVNDCFYYCALNHPAAPHPFFFFFLNEQVPVEKQYVIVLLKTASSYTDIMEAELKLYGHLGC